MKYTFPSKLKIATFVMMGIGLAALIYGFASETERAWSSLLLNGFFFTAIALAGTFFVAVTYVTEGGWQAGIKRIPEAVSQYLPIGALVLAGVIVAGLFGGNHLWHWMDPHFAETDAIFNNSGKSAYLSKPFFIARLVVFLGGWIVFTLLFRKYSKREDLEGGLKWHKKSYKMGAAFLVFFAVSSSMASWDWLMSIDVHWFSTLFGWYIFAGFFVSSLTIMLLLVVNLKRRGYLPLVNENHVHDLAKLTFAFSIFWTYLWFSQYMLIWYSNIPEEINYFLERFNTDYRYVVYAMLFINFAFPLLVLMHRNAKRNYVLVNFAAIVIIIGHYLDMFQIIMPGTVKSEWCIGFLEIGSFLGFFGLFLFVVHSSLAKANLVPQNHPFLNESKQHHI